MSDLTELCEQTQKDLAQFKLELAVMRATLARDKTSDIERLKTEMVEALSRAHYMVSNGEFMMKMLIQAHRELLLTRQK